MNFAHLLLLTDAQQSEKGDFADSPQRRVRLLPSSATSQLHSPSASAQHARARTITCARIAGGTHRVLAGLVSHSVGTHSLYKLLSNHSRITHSPITDGEAPSEHRGAGAHPAPHASLLPGEFDPSLFQPSSCHHNRCCCRCCCPLPPNPDQSARENQHSHSPCPRLSAKPCTPLSVSKQDHNTKLGDVLGDPRKLMAGIRDVTKEAFTSIVGDIAKTVKGERFEHEGDLTKAQIAEKDFEAYKEMGLCTREVGSPG